MGRASAELPSPSCCTNFAVIAVQVLQPRRDYAALQGLRALLSSKARQLLPVPLLAPILAAQLHCLAGCARGCAHLARKKPTTDRFHIYLYPSEITPSNQERRATTIHYPQGNNAH